MVKVKLPAWTWYASFFIILGAKYASHVTYIDVGVHLLYLPHLLGTALFFWWGARVVPGYFLATLLTASMSGVKIWMLAPIDAVISVSKAYLGFFLFKTFVREKSESAVITFLQFFFWVLLIPNLVGNYLVVAQYMAVGDYERVGFWKAYAIVCAVDIVGGIFITYPLAIHVSPWLKLRGMSLWPETESVRHASN